jgi:hypothetical protein
MRFSLPHDHGGCPCLPTHHPPIPLGLDPLFGSYLGGSGEDASVGAGSWLDGKGNWCIPGLHTSTDFPVTPDAFQTANAGGFDVFLAKVALDKPYKGSGQRPGPVTAGSSGPREGLTRDRIAGQ